MWWHRFSENDWPSENRVDDQSQFTFVANWIYSRNRDCCNQGCEPILFPLKNFWDLCILQWWWKLSIHLPTYFSFSIHSNRWHRENFSFFFFFFWEFNLLLYHYHHLLWISYHQHFISWFFLLSYLILHHRLHREHFSWLSPWHTISTFISTFLLSFFSIISFVILMLFFFLFSRDIHHFSFWNFYLFLEASFRWSRWVIKIYQLNDFWPFILELSLLIIFIWLISLILVYCRCWYNPFLISFFSSFIISFLSRFLISIFLIG